jgi:hypothetical protein
MTTAVKQMTTAALKAWLETYESEYERLSKQQADLTRTEDKFLRKYEDRREESSKREN